MRHLDELFYIFIVYSLGTWILEIIFGDDCLILAYLTTMFQLPRLCRVQINVIISYKSESVCMETVVACCKIGLNFITRIKIPRELQYSLPDGPDLCVGICKKYAVDQCTWPSMQWTNVHGQVFWLGSYMLDSAFLKTLPKLKFLWPPFFVNSCNQISSIV